MPEFPASSLEDGAVNPSNPFPSIMICSFFSVIRTPNCLKTAIVLKQSSAFKKLLTIVVPLLIAPNMMLRWEIDLSAGITNSPLIPFLAVNSFMTSTPYPTMKFFGFDQLLSFK